MASEYPKNLYRLSKAGAVEGRLFATEEDVEPGWLEINDEMRAVMAATPVVEPERKKAALAPNKMPQRVGELEQENRRLKAREGELIQAYETLKTLTIELEAQVAAQNEKIALLEGGEDTATEASGDGDGAADHNARPAQAPRAGDRTKPKQRASS